MPTPTLLASAVVGAAAAAAFLLVARDVLARPATGDAAMARATFAIWWAAVAVFSLLVGGVSNALAAFGVEHVALLAAIRTVAVHVLVVGVAALSHYFAYVFTGRRATLWAAFVLYVAVDGVVASAFATRRAVGVDVRTWTTTIVFDPAITPAAWLAVQAAIALPVVLGALASVALARRVGDPAARYRATLTGVSLVAWVGSASLATLVGSDLGRFLAGPVLGMLAAAAMLAAHHPPPWVRRRLDARAAAPA